MAHDATFRHAIPGSSLTHQMGTFPHEKPPKYTDPQEALDYFWKQLNQKEILKQIWNVLENGATVWAVSRAIVYKAATMGLIQMNLGIVIAPLVGKMIYTIGKAKGIDVKLAPKFRDKTTDSLMNQKLNEKLGNTHSSAPIPTSALKSMVIPKSQDVSKDAQKFMAMPIGQNAGLPNDPNAQPDLAPQIQPKPVLPVGKGLLSKANKGAV